MHTLQRYASLLFGPPSPAVPEGWEAVESSVARLHTSIRQCWAAELGFATHALVDESAPVLLDYGQRCAVDCIELLGDDRPDTYRGAVACVRALHVYARMRATRDMLHKVLRLWNAVVGVWRGLSSMRVFAGLTGGVRWTCRRDRERGGQHVHEPFVGHRSAGELCRHALCAVEAGVACQRAGGRVRAPGGDGAQARAAAGPGRHVQQRLHVVRVACARLWRAGWC